MDAMTPVWIAARTLLAEREGRYGEFLAMHCHCSLLDLGNQAENLL